jgi:hypothetical protein
LAHAFAHASQPNACLRYSTIAAKVQSTALVGYFQDDIGRFAYNPNRGDRTAGMAMNVAEAFLHDPKQGALCLLQQSSDVWTGLQRHLDPAPLRESGGVFLHCAGQAHLVEHGRMQLVRQRPQFALALFDDRLAVGDEVLGGTIKPVAMLSHEVKVDRDCDQLLCGGIMQLAANPPALVVP